MICTWKEHLIKLIVIFFCLPYLSRYRFLFGTPSQLWRKISRKTTVMNGLGYIVCRKHHSTFCHWPIAAGDNAAGCSAVSWFFGVKPRTNLSPSHLFPRVTQYFLGQRETEKEKTHFAWGGVKFKSLYLHLCVSLPSAC